MMEEVLPVVEQVDGYEVVKIFGGVLRVRAERPHWIFRDYRTAGFVYEVSPQWAAFSPHAKGWFPYQPYESREVALAFVWRHYCDWAARDATERLGS